MDYLTITVDAFWLKIAACSLTYEHETGKYSQIDLNHLADALGIEPPPEFISWKPGDKIGV